MKWKKINQVALVCFKCGLSTNHGRIITCGLLVGLCYLPVWLSTLLTSTLHGSSSSLLNLSFLYLGLEQIWKQRYSLVSTLVLEEDRWIGYALILGGAAFFPFCLKIISLQAFIWMLVLVGIALSSWGSSFFKNNLLPSMLLLASMYPDLLFLGNQIWRFITPHNVLENFMAWIGTAALRTIGYPAIAEGSIISLPPAGAVEVASGCSGFDMAFTLAGTGLILGLFFKQNWLKITGLVSIGIVLALVFNIPRIMLVTLAAVYWGKDSFEFWHGPIGGQIFSGILLTVYYYLFLGLIEEKKPKKLSS